MEKVKTSHQKYPFPKADVCTEYYSRPNTHNQNKTHTRYHIRDVKEVNNGSVVKDVHGVTEYDVSKHSDQVDELETRGTLVLWSDLGRGPFVSRLTDRLNETDTRYQYLTYRSNERPLLRISTNRTPSRVCDQVSDQV